MPLNQNADRMRRAGFDAECLANIETAMAVSLSPERQAAIRREGEQQQRDQLRARLEELKSFADRVEGGAYGPEGKELARRLLAGGRTSQNLSELRQAIRRLR